MSVADPRAWLAARLREANKGIPDTVRTPANRFSFFIGRILAESNLSFDEQGRIFEHLNSYIQEKTQ